MLTIFVRTLILYVFLILIMRLMGKRQIGELELTDLVTTLLLSEIASLPITNSDIPVSHAIVPMVLLLSLEVFSSYLLLRIPKLKNLLAAQPTILIDKGILLQKALGEVRISLDELIGEVRQQGLYSIEQVEYAILEKDGNLTILPKAKYTPPTSQDLGLALPNEKLMHIVYSNDTFNDVGLSLIAKDRDWLTKELRRRNLELSKLFCVTASEDGKLYYISKQGEKKK